MKTGLLPLYVKLYDDTVPEIRPDIDRFYGEIARALSERGAEVLTSPVCRTADEFAGAIRSFEQGGADAIITLHLAYSPSLESAQALAGTPLPIVVLDTTPSFRFDSATDPSAMMLNHGIHGVQDMCNLLVRAEKDFAIAAGHWRESDVLDRALSLASAAVMARVMRSSRVGVIGGPFAGMGDFQISKQEFAGLGVTLVPFSGELPAVTDAELAAEYALDSGRFSAVGVDFDTYSGSERIGLGVRKWAEREGLTAMTVNFLATGADGPFFYMPFLETSKAMARGMGYAGEGDALTAAFVGALLSSGKDVTFTEMFCPDWRTGSVYLSHMGEFNLACGRGLPRMVVKPFPFTSASDPVVVYDTLKPGKAVFACLAPTGRGEFTLICASGEMLEIPLENAHKNSVNGWYKPNCGLSSFLEGYSRAGGIHHAALIYDGDTAALSRFASLCGWKFLSL